MKRKIYIIGMGMGGEGCLTADAKKALDESELLIGADRIIRIYGDCDSKSTFVCYKAQEIADYIKKHTEYLKIALLYSGDIGFYSGAAGIRELLPEELEVEIIPGISSAIYLMDKLGITWEDAVMTSCHGRKKNLLPLIRRNKKVCALLAEPDDVAELCKRLVYYGLGELSVTVGEKLSYPDERIMSGRAEDLTGFKTDRLSVVLIINEAAPGFVNSVVNEGGAANKTGRAVSYGIRDDEFVRGSVPMTKEEIRTIVLSKLQLKSDSVLYDIGAGTGSVSVEAALLMEEGIVYAIERDEEALKLIEINKRKFIADNIEIVPGTAPEAFMNLKPPTHAFIGGSGGNLEDIVRALFDKNPDIKLVITAVTLETLAQIEKLAKTFEQLENMELVQVGVSRSRRVGSYHLMQAENAVYIATKATL